MQMKRKITAIILSMIMIIITLFGCGSTSDVSETDIQSTTEQTEEKAAEEETADNDEMRTLTLYCSKDAWKPQCEIAAKLIEEKYHIALDIVTMPNEDIEPVIATKLATGDPMDLFVSNAPQTITQYNATQTCEALDDEPWVSRLAAPDLLRFAGDGKIYNMPTYASANFFSGVYYNKEKMKELGYENPQPKTMEEFWAILDDIKRQGVTPIYMTDADAWTTQVFTTSGWAVALYDKKDTIYDEFLSNKQTFAETPEMVEVLTDLQKIYTGGYANENHASQLYDSGIEAVASGEYPMVIQGEWFEEALHDAYPDIELGSFIIPFHDEDIMACGSYTTAFFVPKGSNADLAKEYLRYWSSPEIMSAVYQEIPSATAWNDIDGGDMLPASKNLVENYINTGKYTYEWDSYFDDVRSIMEDYLFAGIVEVTNGKDPTEMLEGWDERYQSFMKDKGVEGF